MNLKLYLTSTSSRITVVNQRPYHKYIGQVLAACGRIMAIHNITLDDILDTPDKKIQRLLVSTLISNGVPKEGVPDVIRQTKISLDRYKFVSL
jgi:hypothetical protein